MKKRDMRTKSKKKTGREEGGTTYKEDIDVTFQKWKGEEKSYRSYNKEVNISTWDGKVKCSEQKLGEKEAWERDKSYGSEGEVKSDVWKNWDEKSFEGNYVTNTSTWDEKVKCSEQKLVGKEAWERGDKSYGSEGEVKSDVWKNWDEKSFEGNYAKNTSTLDRKGECYEGSQREKAWMEEKTERGKSSEDDSKVDPPMWGREEKTHERSTEEADTSMLDGKGVSFGRKREGSETYLWQKEKESDEGGMVGKASTWEEEEEGKIPVDMEKVCNWGNVNPKSQAKEAALRKVANNPFTQPWEESNVVLMVEGVKFYVHRLILILNSPVFKNMLEPGLEEAPTAEITLPGKDADDILNLLKQLYPQEREEISMENVEHLLKLAEEYQIKTVLDLCANFLRCEPKTEDNAMKILLLAQKYRLSNVEDDCRILLAQLSLQRLERYREFPDLNSENLRAIILPRMRRLEGVVKELSPQVSGMVAFTLRLWSQGRNDVAWCPVHIPNGEPLFSIKECLRTCPVCKKVMESLASTTSRGEMYEACKPSECRSSYTDHFDSNFNSVMKNLFDLVD